MSFWKSLFGGGKAEATQAPAAPVGQIEHEGYLIEAKPYLAGSQYQVAGTISKMVGGERKVHDFVRADLCGTIEDAAEMSLRKGKQMVEQAGDRIFGA